MGLNGMGKTTLMKALIGLLSPCAGHGHARRARASRGASRSSASRAAWRTCRRGAWSFPTLTVEENIQTGLPAGEREIPAQLYALLPGPEGDAPPPRRATSRAGSSSSSPSRARWRAGRACSSSTSRPRASSRRSSRSSRCSSRPSATRSGLTIVVSEQVLSFALSVADRDPRDERAARSCTRARGARSTRNRSAELAFDLSRHAREHARFRTNDEIDGYAHQR